VEVGVGEVIGTTKTESKTDLGLLHNKSDRTREVDTTKTESNLSNCKINSK
jgi:hypothetical protein